MSNPPVVLVSLDGIAPRFVTPERMPHLCGLVRSGAGCFTARTVEPPWTRVVHASMLLGVDPTVHGLVDNSMKPLAEGLTSVLALARAAGRSTASANNWKQMDSLIEPLASLHRIFIDSGYDPAEDDLMVDMFASVWAARRPDVSYVYLCRTDLAGHDHGWGSDEYLSAMTEIDRTLGRLLEVVGEETSVVVTTDHGGIGDDHSATTDDVMDIFVAVRSERVAPGSFWEVASMLDIAPTVADLAGLDPCENWSGSSLIGSERPIVDHLLGLVERSAEVTYGEHVNMREHALQTAAALESDGGAADDDLVLAALLHDVGHLLVPAGEFGVADHAEVGATRLGPWLRSSVTEPIRLHVAAKRHLAAVEEGFLGSLSEASVITLNQQGGPMSADESAMFLAEPHAERAMRLRRADDSGKQPGVDAGSVMARRDLLARVLGEGPIDPAGAYDACRCAACRDESSQQHLIDVAAMRGLVTLGSHRTDEGQEVEVRLGDGRVHRVWLPERAPVVTRLAVPWSNSYRPVARDAEDVVAISTDVAIDGLAHVRGIPTDEGEVLRFASTIGFVHETHYGRLFDVRVEPAAINLAYTSLGLPLHTDNPYHDPVPPVQILHCLRPAVSGGANRLSDGFLAAERLRSEDRTAFDLLCSRPVVFRYNGGGFDHSAERTIIECRSDGSVRAIALNHRSLETPADSDFARALQVFSRILEEGEIELTLAAGEAIVFDNSRVLHARTEYDPSEGRHLQGCYVDTDLMKAKARRSLAASKA
ncbi:MAG: TauD/TfdA family dioxygenase [Ilumatobacteraceae bacterium]